MSFTKRLRSWFFRGNAPINPNVLDEDGNATLRDNLANRGVPTQNTMQDLTASAVFFTQSEDRAKETSGGPIEDEVGHVAIATDVQAKANTDGLLDTSRTLAVHPGQLPTVEADPEPQLIDGSFQADFEDTPIEVEVDPDVDTRNNFLLRFKQSLLDFISGITNQIQTNISNISTNTSNISTNTNSINDINNTLTGGTLDVLEGGTGVVTPATTLNFDADDFDVADAGGGTANIEVAASIKNAATDGTLDVRESNITVRDPVNEMNFDGADFNLLTFAPGQVVITASALLSSGIPGNWINEEGAALNGRISITDVTGPASTFTVSINATSYSRYIQLNSTTIIYNFWLDFSVTSDNFGGGVGSFIVRYNLAHTGKTVGTSFQSSVCELRNVTGELQTDNSDFLRVQATGNGSTPDGLAATGGNELYFISNPVPGTAGYLTAGFGSASGGLVIVGQIVLKVT
jgi:hypothetical protein